MIDEHGSRGHFRRRIFSGACFVSPAFIKKSELYLMVVVNTCQQGVSYCTDCTLIAL